ncbi:MAG: nitroreductase family protein [Candidatus Omnitrophica bacterium]|nr:nitroreductase family protein [Candidatus Omnitrophota bacterium]
MDAINTLKLRRSVRVYQANPIPKEILEKLIDVARFSPTARNVQPWEFVVVTKSEILKKFGELGDNCRFLANATACIAVFSSDTKYYLEDGCAATVNILNAACAYGIGSCWIAGDKKPYCDEVIKILGVPVEFKLVSLISLGYPEDKNSFKLVDKKSLKEMLHWEKF